MRPILRRAWMLVFLFPVVFLIPVLGEYILLRGAVFSDLAISHLPNALWIQRSLLEWGQVPLWSNSILSGYPFAANPLSGLHYPFGWLALIFPQPLGLNLVILLHLIAGGVGMYHLMRTEGLERIPALLGALGFEAMPKLFAHLGAGHVTLVYAVSWTPWLLLAESRPGRRWWQPAVVLGLIGLADPRWAILAGGLWGAFALARGGSFRPGRWALHIGGGGLLALLLAAALLLPLAEYTRLSTRVEMSAADNLAFSLAPVQLLGLLTPGLGATPEYTLYSGGIVLALAMLGLWLAQARKRAGFWYGLALACLAISLGSNLPGAGWVAGLPGVNLLRVPTRALFAAGMAFSAAAAVCLQVILSDPGALKRLPRISPLPLMAGLVFLLAALSLAGWRVTGELPLRFAWGAAALLVALISLIAARSGRLAPERVGWLCLGLMLLDLCGSNLIGLEARPASQMEAQGAEAAALISKVESGGRVYSPSYSLPQQTAARFGLELADGVDPLQLAAYARFMRSASGVRAEGYSVTLPAFTGGDPVVDNRDARPDARLLGLLNVGTVAAEFPLDVDGLEEIGRFGSTVVYSNDYAMPRAWVQQAGAAADPREAVQARIERWSPNRITVTAEGPGRLIFSEIAYPGWRVLLDGADAMLVNAVVLRAVDLPAGRHRIELVFRPTSVYAGVGISLFAWLAVGLLWRRRKAVG